MFVHDRRNLTEIAATSTPLYLLWVGGGGLHPHPPQGAGWVDPPGNICGAGRDRSAVSGNSGWPNTRMRTNIMSTRKNTPVKMTEADAQAEAMRLIAAAILAAQSGDRADMVTVAESGSRRKAAIG